MKRASSKVNNSMKISKASSIQSLKTNNLGMKRASPQVNNIDESHMRVPSDHKKQIINR